MAHRKAIHHLFDINPFVEKYVLRIILEYDGRFIEQNLDEFAHTRKQSQHATPAPLAPSPSPSPGTGSDEEDVPACEHGHGHGDGHTHTRTHAHDLSIAVDHVQPQSSAAQPLVEPLSASHVEMEEIHVRFHFPALAGAENDVDLASA